MNGATIVQAALNGLMLASVYALVALGLTVVFGLMHIVNFAQGQLLLLGAYGTYALVESGLPYPVAVLVAVLGVAALGALLDVGLFKRVRGIPISGLLLSIGLIAIIDNVIHEIWERTPRRVPAPVTHVFRIGDVSIPGSRLLVIAGAALSLVLLAWMVRRTRTGLALRATAQNPEAAELMGIATERVRHLAFALGAGLAALGGALFAAVFAVEPVLGETPLVKAFMVLIIGGAGSPLGAVLGALIIGMTESFGVTWWSRGAAEILALILLVTVLLIRPAGLIRTTQENPL